MAQEMRNVDDEQLVIFRLADEYYAVNIGTVQEIIAWQPVTRVPRAQYFVEGLINLRGNVIPIIDLRKRFGFGEAEVGRETRVVVVEIGQVVVGLIVDGVSEVLRVSASQIEPASTLAADADLVRGVAKTGDRLITLLDLGNLLAESEQQCLSSATVATIAGERQTTTVGS